MRPIRISAAARSRIIYSSSATPFRTAEAFGIEDIIDPRQTRSYIYRFLEHAYDTISTNLDVKGKAGVRP